MTNLLEILIEDAVGAVAAGSAPLREIPENVTSRYAHWLKEGNAAGMEYLHNHIHIRRNPTLLLEGGKSIISVAFSYTPDPDTESKLKKGAYKPARFALGDDYHDVVRKRLGIAVKALESHYGGEYRICVDSAPIFERYWAERCGIGSRCDNGLIYVPGYGTRIFLAEILSTIIFPSSTPVFKSPGNGGRGEGCLHCGACLRACPASALQKEGTVDARRCLSYLTIEHKGEWDDTGKKAISTTAGRTAIFGCDMCQDCCPLNRDIPATGISEFFPRDIMLSLTDEKIAALDPPGFSRLFKGSPVKRTKLSGLRRNAGLPAEDAPNVK